MAIKKPGIQPQSKDRLYFAIILGFDASGFVGLERAVQDQRTDNDLQNDMETGGLVLSGLLLLRNGSVCKPPAKKKRSLHIEIPGTITNRLCFSLMSLRTQKTPRSKGLQSPLSR